jgi:preprotein translocase subunit SecE
VARDRLVPRRSSLLKRVQRRSFLDSGVPRVIRRRAVQARAMANPFEFIQEVRTEANKVTWPTRRETLITTVMVLVMVVAASGFFVAVDQVLSHAVALFLEVMRPR